jgi:mutator protein MutT
MKITTIVFLIKKDSEGKTTEVLLAMKKRGFGEGLWNGSGGKMQEGETPLDAAIREVREELEVEIKNPEEVAVMEFLFKDNPEFNSTSHVYFVTEWEGEPTETEEMRPKWFKVNEIPTDQMWDSDKEWIPVILSGERIEGRYLFDSEGKVIHSGIKKV